VTLRQLLRKLLKSTEKIDLSRIGWGTVIFSGAIHFNT